MKIKSIFPAIFGLMLQVVVFAQDLSPISGFGSFGVVIPLQKAKEVDFVNSLAMNLGLQYDIKIAKSNALRLGIGYESFTSVNDGYFTKDDAGKSIFTSTPATYQNNRQQMAYVFVPIAWAIQIPENNTNYEVVFSFQPGYQVQNLHFYKENGQKFKENAETNKWRYVLGLEYGWYRTNDNKVKIKYATCFNYQISNFVEQGRSFNPFFATFKVTYMFSKK